MKGLVQYLNWQDRLPSRIQTISNDYPRNKNFTAKVNEEDIIFSIKGHPVIQKVLEDNPIDSIIDLDEDPI